MDAFLQQVDTVKAAIQATVSIAKGEVADTIDIESYVGDLVAMANQTFTGPQLSASQKMARKDAFDFISACSRTVDHFKLDRAAYYTSAVETATVLTERLEYAKATANLFDSVKAKK